MRFVQCQFLYLTCPQPEDKGEDIALANLVATRLALKYPRHMYYSLQKRMDPTREPALPRTRPSLRARQRNAA